MGLAFYGRRRSRFIIETVVRHCLASGDLDDPLLRFTTQLESDALDARTETVNLACLFSCQGAVTDALEHVRTPSHSLPRRLESLGPAAGASAASAWRPLLPQEVFRSGILLLQAERGRSRDLSAHELRRAFSERGVALTAYDGGVLRLSMPADGWRPGELEHLGLAMRAIA